jgi:hypothetical protein
MRRARPTTIASSDATRSGGMSGAIGVVAARYGEYDWNWSSDERSREPLAGAGLAWICPPADIRAEESVDT